MIIRYMLFKIIGCVSYDNWAHAIYDNWVGAVERDL